MASAAVSAVCEDQNPWSATASGTRSALTRANRRVLDGLALVLEREGTASIREIGKAAGLSSPSSVAHHLHKLALHGYVEAPVHNRPRGWRLSGRGWTVVSSSRTQSG